MNAHTALSPSKRLRWSLCPGSIREAAKFPEPPSGPAAIDGTHSHTLLEHCIKGNLADPIAMIGIKMSDRDGEFTVDAERAQRVKVAVDYVRQRVQQLSGMCVVRAETRADPAKLVGRDDMGGTYDIRILGGDVCEIIDYKDGMHHVPVVKNPQLEQYAIGDLASFEEGRYPFSMIRLTVIQPKLAAKGMNPISSWDEPVEYYLETVLPALKAQAAACDAPDAPLVPGDEQCRYCPAKGACAALAGHATSAVTELFGPVGQGLVEASAATDPNAMPVEKIREILEAAPLLRQMIEAVETEALRRMKAGVTIPGLKVVNGRGSRKWALPEEQIEQKLKSMGMPKDAIWKSSLVSPAQVEKVVWENRKGEKKQLSERQMQTIQKEYVAHVAGSLTVALESDSRPAVVMNAAPMFAAVEPAAPELPAWLQ